MDDAAYMRMALELAAKGCGWVSPNPLVGAVIVKEGRVIGRGYHARYGEKHAERNALEACAESPQGAELYVTLEPCCHQGKQPPCVEAILEAGIRRVVVGSPDPNPLVSGKGVEILRSQGVEVTEGVLREACDRLNPVFFHFIQTGRPYVVFKYAMTLDGKTAAYTGASRWITGEEARRHVHRQRHRYRSILVGVGTVLADDPLLTCRLEEGRNPVRIVCDSRLRTPLDSQLVRTAREAPVILATCCREAKRQEAYRRAGCQVWELPEERGPSSCQAGGPNSCQPGGQSSRLARTRVDLEALLERLGREQVDSVLVEGGGTLGWQFFKRGLVQRVQAYLAPMLLGGDSAKTPVAGQGFPSPGEAVRLKNSTVTQLGADFLIEGEVETHVYRNR